MTKTPVTNEEGRGQISLRLKVSLLQALRKRAKKSGESMNSQIEAAVARDLAMESSVNPSGFAQSCRENGDVQETLTVGRIREQHASVSIDPKFWRLRQFLRWLPVAALIQDLDGRTVLANEELGRVVGRKHVAKLKPSDYLDSSAAAWIEAHDQFVRDNNASIICIERVPVSNSIQERLGLRFPIKDKNNGVIMTGALSFDLGQLRATEILKTRDKGRRPCRMPPVYSSDYPEAVANSLLAGFVRWMPAIAAVKDPCGHLLCVNQEFHDVTHKGREVIGRLPSENWPPETAALITAHDQLVRETGAPFISVETITPNIGATIAPKIERLNVRFPIFRSEGEMEMTGVLGLDYSLMKAAIEELSQADGYRKVCVLERDQDQRPRFVEVGPNYSESLSEARDWGSMGVEV